ncbi:bifunctional ADP-dependent NAD(P)H-hydrate dehydratase/NAD(P)H-hydrate epimerase [Nanchangia anserum]|uniref:ADP-dependent (S)-NAD(P)H-hydrate dehydratase n=1 Tax=Nanchangia anserum TaxID=2692125 RepID=A0A8I0GEC5_9ACTO|nr:bifunctional ADP-dependent NAD(P)H-hydrate dehydratase/NAD(P)H-hydrate epimerase [Nanchangia anserum]MBD3689958.1 bifunctional ADP-dependent NAD(P)H-hydrate dehydratase/NAD(P)H-hydrate epimerase [Nanchangia anserum]QOX82235.1 bifunctional ADP-dependent NAD(P)H-hydrate dehydratase/NAD(P)H-hydrate epimerase [Nanchangia anserum]
MISAFDTATIRQAEYDLVAHAPLDHVMKKAAGAVAETCAQLIAARDLARAGRVVALVGGGDNGGDALYAVAMLARSAIECDAVILHAEPHPRGCQAAEDAGVHLVRPDLSRSPRAVAQAVARTVIGCDVIIDGLVGTGGRGALREPFATVVTLVRAGLADAGDRLGRTRRQSPQTGHRPGTSERSRRPLVVAVDTPSGLGGEDGSVAGVHLPADVTVTMGALKPQAVLPPASYSVGQVRLCDLGVTISTPERARSLGAGDVGCAWSVPGPSDHKYTRGVAQVVAGSTEYPFTGVMCVEAAARTGAGMVRYSGPAEASLAVLSRVPEAVGAPGRFQACLLGPGLSERDDARIEQAGELMRTAHAANLPMVLDAGALRAWRRLVSQLPGGEIGPLAVLTPHAGEAAMLLTHLGAGSQRGGISRAEVEAEPLRWATRLTECTGAIVVLKGAATLIVAPGEIPYVQHQAPAWAGTAGSGDVLAGILVAVAAAAQAQSEQAGAELTQADLARRIAAGVWVHGTAARLAAGLRPDRPAAVDALSVQAEDVEPIGAGAPIIATDIIAAVPQAIRHALAAGPLRYAG